ncbi:MAG TPA: hypothetical protein VF629_08745 [Hymenobacter sp.]|uniref:hypothetical protein n=1 Tax=Hymenobacter sp. TaxID=1898978 RepID=UPI002ED7E358
MFKRNWHYLLLLFLLLDFGYSFWHYLQFNIDGDLVPIVAPSEAVRPVLHDPFGLGPLLRGEQYAAPNRFFAVFFLYEYFRHVPLLLQSVVSPVDSLYLACALIKIGVHLLLVYVLAVAVSNRPNVLSKDFLLAAVLITPFLQTSGFNNAMGVIDWSITYTIFYALPMSVLLLFMLPFLRAALHGAPLRESWLGYLGLLGLVVVLSFNGAIMPGVVLIVCPTVLLVRWYRRFAARPTAEPVVRRALQAVAEVPRLLLVTFTVFSVLSLYSLFIGYSNSENQWASIPLLERYARVPLGVYYLFTGREMSVDKYGFSLLTAMVVANVFVVRRQLPAPLAAKVLTVGMWLALFAAVYLLLLPLGGFRTYREYIVRRDSILPITLGMIGFFAYSAYYLLTSLPAAVRLRYAVLAGTGLAIFTVTDRYKPSESNACERSLFAQLASSPDPIVQLPATCTMMDWQPLTDYRNSGLNGMMLHYWNVTETRKLYYQK